MKLNIFSILLGLFGQGLIIAGFLLFGGQTPTNILWLNIIVTSIVFWLLATSFGLRPINLEDPTQKQVGGLGLRWYSTILYSIIAIGFMVVCALYALDSNDYVDFKLQLGVQLVLLLLLLVGMLSSAHATQKTGQVYQKEQQILQGKKELKYALNDLSYIADCNPEIPADLRRTLKLLSDETRYLTPSSSPRAIELDDRIFAVANRLRAALKGPYELNRPQLEQLLPRLRRDFNQRKQFI